MKQRSLYAEGTTVSVEQSRQEVMRLLERYGAEQFMFGQDGERTVFQFRMEGVYIKQSVARPDVEDFAVTDCGRARTDAQIEQAVDREWRRRWRALVLILKAKLEIVASGESTVVREFMPDILLTDGSTIEQRVAPQLAAGAMPKLLTDGGRAQ